jgi:hypothetical protein
VCRDTVPLDVRFSCVLAFVRPCLGLLEMPIMLFIVLIVVLVLALAGGGWGHSRYGSMGWSPAVLILIVFAALYLTGHL